MTALSPFSYDVLKNVISHLDIQTRLQISLYCPELEIAERKADLHLDALSLHDNYLAVDGFRFVAMEDEEYFMSIEGPDFEDLHRIPVAGHDNYFQKVIDMYFANRDYVKVNQALDVGYSLKMIERLPKDLKIECRRLLVENDHIAVLPAIRPFLTNLPLERLDIYVTKPEDPVLQDELVQGAKHLVITTRTDKSIVKDLVKLRNPYITVTTSNFKTEDVMTLVEDWLVRCPEVGTTFCWDTNRDEYLEDVMHLLENKYKRLPLSMRSGHKLIFTREYRSMLSMKIV